MVLTPISASLWFVALASGAANGEAAAPLPEELVRVAEKMKQVQRLSARMHQEKDLAAFGEVITSEGSLYFERPRRLRMDLRGPGGTIVIINGDEMVVHYKALRRTERTSLSRDPRARAMAEHLFLWLEADPRAWSRVYSLEVTNTHPVTVRLVPKLPSLRAIIASVQARFDEQGLLAALTLHDATGDTTRWRFEAPTINGPLADDTFRLVE